MKRFSFLFIAFTFMILSACSSSTQEQEGLEDFYQDTQEAPPTNLTDPMTDPKEETTMIPDFDQTAPPEAGERIVVMETNKGTIKLRLFPQLAPETVENFVKLTQDGFYDGLTFHRVISGFMIQGGDPDGSGSGGPGYTIPAEINPQAVHLKGALATARLPDSVNPEKASSGSQFYIVHGDARGLDGEYTVFGQLFEGMEVVDEIANVETGPMDKPIEDVVMETVKVETYE